jgi:lysyl-tRNA synthetase class 2
MIEWYRLGQTLDVVMRETAQLAAVLLEAGGVRAGPFAAVSYADAFRQALSCDPLAAPDAHLAELAARHGLAASSIASATRNELLDFLVATVVGPRLGRGSLCGLHHFPAAQAALARRDEEDGRTALRFELYAQGVELANGYIELADVAEQRGRFEADRIERRQRDQFAPDIDGRLLAAMSAGLPECAGVAMGFDRVAMLALGATRIDEVLAFAWDRA